MHASYYVATVPTELEIIKLCDPSEYFFLSHCGQFDSDLWIVQEKPQQ
jgi:hypothetical protein